MHISGTAWWIQLKYGIGGAPPETIHAKNFMYFCSGSVELQVHENGGYTIKSVGKTCITCSLKSFVLNLIPLQCIAM